jgi:2-amino-4-hydroxy-6-hydroxymethyldihydropteridine diphosphokinase
MPVNLHKAILSLGSNIGDRADWLAKAAAAVAALPDTQISARSSIYETEAVDVPTEFRDQPFLNAVLLIETTLTAQQLSTAVHLIEDQLERTRNIPNQPRTIDIDIITFDNLISHDANLTLPHPQAHQRRFVLQPLVEIAPEFTLPSQTVSVAELLNKLPHEPTVKPSAKQW